MTSNGLLKFSTALANNYNVRSLWLLASIHIKAEWCVVCLYACMYVCLYVCMHVCMNFCIHVCMNDGIIYISLVM